MPYFTNLLLCIMCFALYSILVFTYENLVAFTGCFYFKKVWLFIMVRTNLNKSKKNLDFYYHSIKVHTQEAQNLHQLKSPFQTSLHKFFKNCFSWSKSCFTMFTFRCTFTKWIWDWKLKGISIDADSGPLGYVLWCCGSLFFRSAVAILWLISLWF